MKKNKPENFTLMLESMSWSLKELEFGYGGRAKHNIDFSHLRMSPF